jgi:GNAT superfamily N-acetyltransferase
MTQSGHLMDMNFTLLADHREAIPQIASWYFDQWGHLRKDADLRDFEKKLQCSLNHDKLPLVILALENEEIVGVAELKFREMAIFPEREHWLGGIYVPVENRGRGIAAQLIQQALRIARTYGVATLFLQTERLDGGLYASLGWTPIEQVNYRGLDVLVMEKILDGEQLD